MNLIFQSCEKVDSKIDYVLTTADAKDIITKWIYNDYNPDMNPSFTFSVIEYTTEEIYEKLKGQVFGVISDVPGLNNRWFFIKNKKVYDLFYGGQYATESDFDNLLVTDLNNDSKYELSYTAHAGSGVLIQIINCFYFMNDNLSQLSSNVICRFPLDYQIHLQKDGFKKLMIKYADDKYDLIIGEVKLSKQDDKMELIVELKEEVPQEIIDKLNGNN